MTLSHVLVVETFGFWSPFALQTLRTIAERTTARSGASTKQARKHSEPPREIKGPRAKS